MVEVMAWLPLVFLLLEKALLKKKLTYAVFAGFFFGVSALAGHPQTSHGMVFVLVVHTAYRAAAIYVKERNKNIALYATAMLAVFLGIGVLIAAAQILPTYELVKESTRGSAVALDYAAKSAQLSLRDAVLLIVPNYFGALTRPYWGDIDISQNIIYVGVAPLLLAGLALLGARKRPDMIYFFVMTVFFLLLSLGENGPVFSLLYQYVPGFKYFRGPANTLFLYTFFAALLSGYGFSSLAGGLRKRSLLLYTGVVLLFCIVLYQLSPGPPTAIAAPAAENIQSGFQAFLGLFFLSAIIMFISVSYPRFRNYCFAALLVVTFIDLYLHFSDSATIAVKEAPRIYEKQTDLITAIKKDSGVEAGDGPGIELNKSEVEQGLFRIYTKPEGVPGTLIFGINRAMLFRTFLVEGFEPLEISRHRRLIDTLSPRNLDNLLKMTNVKYITKIDSGNVDVQRYLYPLPRTYVVYNAKFMENDDRVLEELAVFDPASEVIISGKGMDITGQTTDASYRVSRVSRYTGSLVEIRTQSRKDGFLVLSDTFYPGWQAWIDDVEYPVMRANYDFRAVQLPAGEHTVVFKFTSRYLRSGLFISLAGLLIVGLFLFKTIYPLLTSKKITAANNE
jgi:hypothetical protein